MEINDGWKLNLDVYEGPLDLLLFLVKKDEVNIYDIPIQKITEQYMEYLRLMKMLDLNIAGEYLVMSSTLLYIKSQMLLPEEVTEDEEFEDPRTQLVEQLLEYKKYKEAGQFLREKEEAASEVFRRNAPDVIDVEEHELELSIFDLLSSFSRVLKTVEERRPEELFYEEVSVEEKIANIRKLAASRKILKFSSLFDRDESRYHVLATFLAILELIKLGEIKAIQADKNADITIKLITPEGQVV